MWGYEKRFRLSVWWVLFNRDLCTGRVREGFPQVLVEGFARGGP